MLRKIDEHGSREELIRHRKLVSVIVASLDLDILAPIYREHPALERLDHGLHPDGPTPTSD